MAKNRIFSGQDGREDAIKYLKQVYRKYTSRQRKFSKTAIRLSDLEMPEVNESDTTKDIYQKAWKLQKQINERIEKHKESVRKWKGLGQAYADDANESKETEPLKQRRGGSAEKLYAFIIDSLGGDREPEDYPSDDVLEAADTIIQDGELITKQNLKDEIEKIKQGREKTKSEDVESIDFGSGDDEKDDKQNNPF